MRDRDHRGATEDDAHRDAEKLFENVKSLEMMGITSAVIVLLFFIKCFFLPTPATFIVVLTFFIAGLFSEVLSFVFREAIRYKEENDLTI